MKRILALLLLTVPMLAQNVVPNSFASDFQTVPVMGNVPGAGARFQTFVAIMNPTSSAFPVEVALYDTQGTRRTAAITLDAAVNSQFPNGRRLGGGTSPASHQVNVNTVLISLIAAGDPGAGLARGVEVNDKNFVSRFPFLAPAHNGLLQGHGGTNTPPVD